MYHVVRGQAVIKLYIFYNMLEVADKLLSSFGQVRRTSLVYNMPTLTLRTFSMLYIGQQQHRQLLRASTSVDWALRCICYLRPATQWRTRSSFFSKYIL